MTKSNDDESFGVGADDAKLRSRDRKRGISGKLDDGVGVGSTSAKTFVFRGTKANLYWSGGLLKPKTARDPVPTRSVSVKDQRRILSLSLGGL